MSVSERCVVVVGGEHFKGRNNISPCLLVCLYRAGAATWYSIAGPELEARAAHCMVSIPSGLYILTGRNERKLLANICKLVVK